MHASKGSQDFSAFSSWAGLPKGPKTRVAEEPDEPYAHIHLIERLIDEEGDKTKPVVMKSPLNFSAISSAHSSVNHTPQLSNLNSPQPVVPTQTGPSTVNTVPTAAAGLTGQMGVQSTGIGGGVAPSAPSHAAQQYSNYYNPGVHYKAYSDDMRKLRPKKFVNYAEKLNYFGTKKLIDQHSVLSRLEFNSDLDSSGTLSSIV